MNGKVNIGYDGWWEIRNREFEEMGWCPNCFNDRFWGGVCECGYIHSKIRNDVNKETVS